VEYGAKPLQYKTTTMFPFLIISITQVLFLVSSCETNPGYKKQMHRISIKEDQEPGNIKTIPLPEGYNHIHGADSLFADWLLSQPLRKDKTVYLYDGSRKQDQYAQFAVLDIDIGKKNLVQCADAVIKMRAGFLFQSGRTGQINFQSTTGTTLSFSQWQEGWRWREHKGKLVRLAGTNQFNSTLQSFESYMDLVYSYCGTYSLSRQLEPVPGEIQPGDVFVHGGFPGHAVIIMSVAENKVGKKIFMLAQGFMPAQDIHILINPGDAKLSPWYSTEEIFPLITTGWKFNEGSLMRW